MIHKIHWEWAHLGEVARIRSGGTPSRTEQSYWGGNIPWITTSLINFNTIDHAEEHISEEGLRNSSAKIVSAGTILMALYGQGITRGKVALLGIDAATNQACASIIPNQALKTKFLFYYLQYQYNSIRNIGHGGNQQNLSGLLVKEIPIPLPTPNEQERIVELLETWDRDIDLTEHLIAAKQERHKWLMQQLLTGKRRLPGFTGSWTMKTLGKLVDPIRRSVPKPKEAYKALGIRSHCKGTFERVVNDPTTVDMEELFVVRGGDLIVNITFAWEGAIAFVPEGHDGYLVSHRFPTYRLKENEVDHDFFRYVVTHPRFIFQLRLISPGGAGRNRVMSKRDFLDIEVLIPCLEEQHKIGQLLRSVDAEIRLLNQEFDALREQKKGLMQQLLTGKKRVKILSAEAIAEGKS